MKRILVIITSTFIYANAENVKCQIQNFVVFPREITTLLKRFPQVFMTMKITSPSDIDKPTLIKKDNLNEVTLVEGRGLSVGDVIKTKSGQTVELKFFMPTEQTIKIGENSEVRVSEIANLKCQSAFEIIKGSITSEGTHSQMQEIQNCAAEIQTQNSEVRPTGTKYSVDLNEAIAEASGEVVQTESYSVEKGSIEVRLKIAIPASKSKTLRIAKNGSFKLKAGQKAKVKTNSKTKIADVQVIEP